MAEGFESFGVRKSLWCMYLCKVLLRQIKLVENHYVNIF